MRLPCRFQLPLQRHDDVDQAIDVDPSVAHVLLELLDGVHAGNLSNHPSCSCAKLPEKPVRKWTTTFEQQLPTSARAAMAAFPEPFGS